MLFLNHLFAMITALLRPKCAVAITDRLPGGTRMTGFRRGGSLPGGAQVDSRARSGAGTARTLDAIEHPGTIEHGRNGRAGS